MTTSGLQIIYTLDEVDFVQNLVFYIESTYIRIVFVGILAINHWLVFGVQQMLIELQTMVSGKEATRSTMDSLNSTHHLSVWLWLRYSA